MKTILVIEDFSGTRQVICNTLQSKGYRTIPVASGMEAFDVLTQPTSKVNLVLSDFNMPDIRGFDLLETIKSNPELENIPVVFLTTELYSDKIRIAQETGLAGFIQKPFREKDFFQEIKRVMKASSAMINFVN